ncbi:TPA: phage head closure protein [Klebsiella quasipneumoniae subsp. similipneumoniae]
MKIGPMRHRITIRNFITTRTPSGQPTEEWSDGATIWADVKGISGRESLTAGAERADATIRVWVRYRKDISASSRLLVLNGPYKGVTLNVTGPPVPDSKGTRLEILCKQGTEK